MGFLFRKFQGGEETELEDIQRNLRHLLEAKRDGSAHFPDFGLSEPTHASVEQALLQYGTELRQTIGRYEPRVRVEELEEVYDDDGRASLALILSLRRTNERLSLVVDPRKRNLRWRAPDDGPDDEDD